MTIFFLGTSNCIVHGSFVETVRSLSREPVVNVSVGSCSAGVGMYVLPDIQPRPGDVAILDYAITDTLVMLQNIRTPREIRAYLDTIVARLLEAGCTPIVAINALRDQVDGPMPGREVHLELCRDWGLAYVDHVALLRHARQAGAPMATLMADSAHFTVGAHAIIGRAMIAAIGRARREPPLARQGRPAGWTTRRLMAADLAAPAVTRRGSRLRSADLAILREGDRIMLPIGAGERMLGVMVNMAAAGAKVRFEGGETAIIANLEYDWDNLNPSAFMSLFVEFRHYLRGGSEGIALEVLPQHAVATEPFHPRVPIAGCYGEIQIEGVLVGSSLMPSSQATPSARPIDLLAGLYPDLTAQLLGIDGRRELAA